MSTLPFSFFKQGNEEYEVVDKYARQQLSNGSRKYLFLGDSYALGQGATNNYSWVDRVIEDLGLTSDDYVKCTSSDVGMLPAFWATTSEHRSWVDSIAIMKNRISSTLANEITDVVVAGGYNEIFSPNKTDAEIETPMQQFIAYCKTNFPNAKVWLGFIGYNVLCTSAAADIRKDLNRRVWKVYSRGVKHGFKVMNGVDHCIWWNSDTDGGGVHPNADTYKIIGDAIASNLVGVGFESVYNHGNYSQDIFSESDFTAVGNITAVHFTAKVERISNDHCNLRFNPYIVFSNVPKQTNGHTLALGTIDSKLPINNSIYICSGIFALYPASGSAISFYHGRLTLDPDGTVKVYFDGFLYGTVIPDGTSVTITAPFTADSLYLDHNTI